MRLPTFRATTAPPRETGLVRADPRALTDTGDAEFRALQQVGGAIRSVGGVAGQFAIERKNLDNEAAAGRADARSIDALTEATNAINGQDFSLNTVLPDDPKKYYSGETGDILEFTTEDKVRGREEQIRIVNGRLENLSKAMNFRGEKARLRWLEGKKNKAREHLTKVSNAKQTEFQTEMFLGNARNAAANGDMEVSEQWIDLAEKSGLIGPKKAATTRLENGKLSAETIVINKYREGDELYKLGLDKEAAATYNEARKLADSAKVFDADEKVALQKNINTAEKTIKTSIKVNNDTAIEAELQAIDDVVILPQDEFLASATETLRKINESEILPVKGKNGAGKEGQRKKINDRIKAISEGKTDPINQFDPSAYSKLERRITQNSMMVKGTDITSRVGRGQTGGITAAQAKDLTALKKFYDGADVLGTDLHRIYSGAIVGLRTSKTFSKNKADNVLYAARASSALNAWAVKNPNATEADYQAFFDRLMDRSFMDNWGRGWFARAPEEQRIAVRENIEAFEEELGIRNVKVISPDGKPGTIPAAQLEQAIKEGYKEVD